MSTMDLSGVIASFATGSYTVTRTTTASYGTDGRAVNGSQSTLTVNGLKAPLNGRDLQNLSEGMRTKQLLNFWSQQELKTQGSGFEPDVVTISGDQWQVQSVQSWSDNGNFFQYLLMRVGN